MPTKPPQVIWRRQDNAGREEQAVNQEHDGVEPLQHCRLQWFLILSSGAEDRKQAGP